jgi:hypothetical protein
MKATIKFICLPVILGLAFSFGTTDLVAAEKTGYEVDGRTSASVLAAKRSHEVTKSDELGLSIVSGLFVIAIIGYFSHLWFDRK